MTLLTSAENVKYDKHDEEKEYSKPGVRFQLCLSSRLVLVQVSIHWPLGHFREVIDLISHSKHILYVYSDSIFGV